YQREDGFDGLRADFGPSLFLPFRLGRALTGSLGGGLRETAYHLTDNEQVAFVVPNDPNISRQFRTAPEQPRLDTDRSQETAEFRGRMGTEFDRVFNFRHLGLEKVKHTIEPEVRYFFVPGVGRPILDTVLPACSTLAARGVKTRPGDNCDATLFSEGYLFDERDAVNRRNFFSYGITTRLLGRGPTTTEAAAHEVEPLLGEEPAPTVSAPIDPNTLPQGLSNNALPDFVGPPAPPGTSGAPVLPAARELVRASILHGY